MSEQVATTEERVEKLQGLGSARKRVEDARFTQGKGNYVDDIKLPGMVFGDFVRSPYGHARIKGIVTVGDGEHRVESATESDAQLRVVLDRTPFYGESGGQVGDSGEIVTAAATFEVERTEKDGSLIVHFGNVKRGTLSHCACRPTVHRCPVPAGWHRTRRRRM